MLSKNNGSTADVLNEYKIKIVLYKVVVGILVAFIAVLAVTCVYLGSLPKSVPWVIELTADGEATYYPDAVKLLDSWTPNDATQRYFISRYVMYLRGVSTDNYVNKDNAADVFSKSLDEAGTAIQKWYTENNPIERSATEYVQIPIEEISIVKFSDTQWKVTWRETTYRRSDKMITSDKQYEGLFTTAFYTPDTERRKRENPIGMYVIRYDLDLLKDLL